MAMGKPNGALDIEEVAQWLKDKFPAVEGDGGWATLAARFDAYILSRDKTRLSTVARKSAERHAAVSLAGREIGSIPDVVDAGRKEACRLDLKRFLLTYFPDKFQLAFSPAHGRVVSHIEDAVLRGNLFALALPRGSGKTTICERAALWAIAYGHRRFVVLIGASEDAARSMLDEIKMECETNELFGQDFPAICYPVRKMDGINQRAAGQLCDGERTRITWTDGEIVFPTVRGAESSGAVVDVRGITGRVRGMKAATAFGESIRPDLVLVDDPQTDESAASPEQNRKRVRILCGAILGLAGPGKKISGVMPCTVIRKGDMADEILDRSRHPEWQGERCKMLESFPTNAELWGKYAEILRDGQRGGEGEESANEFYARHREEMDAGGVVYWEARKNDGDISALQHAMNLYIRDKDSFYAEFQNEPIDTDGGDGEQITVQRVWNKMDCSHRHVVPSWAEHLSMYIDVQKRLLYYVIVASGNDFTARVIDYGSWPKQSRRYWTLDDANPSFDTAYKGKSLEGAIYSAITDLATEKLGATYVRDEDGQEMHIGMAAVDSAWGASTKAVYSATADLAKTFPGRIISARGRGISATQRPFSEYRRERGTRIGLNWRIYRVANGGARLFEIDTNWWKSFVRQRLFAQKGEGGTLTLWGKDAEEHRMYAEHLSSERSAATSSEWRVVDVWRMIPGRENHLLDCTVGAMALANYLGASLSVGTTVAEAIKRAEPMKLKPIIGRIAPSQKAVIAPRR